MAVCELVLPSAEVDKGSEISERGLPATQDVDVSRCLVNGAEIGTRTFGSERDG